MQKAWYQVIAGLTRITPTALVEKVRNCITLTTGNAAFPSPTPTLAELKAATDALDAVNQTYAFNRGRADKDLRDSAFADLRNLTEVFAGYVQGASNGDKDTILSAGLGVRRSPQPVGELPAPKNVRALVTPYPGRIDVIWGGVPARLMYRLEQCSGDPNDPANWTTVLYTGKNRHVVEGLESDKVYHFRVVALGAAGASPVSDAASAKAA